MMTNDKITYNHVMNEIINYIKEEKSAKSTTIKVKETTKKALDELKKQLQVDSYDKLLKVLIENYCMTNNDVYIVFLGYHIKPLGQGRYYISEFDVIVEAGSSYDLICPKCGTYMSQHGVDYRCVNCKRWFSSYKAITAINIIGTMIRVFLTH